MNYVTLKLFYLMLKLCYFNMAPPYYVMTDRVSNERTDYNDKAVDFYVALFATELPVTHLSSWRHRLLPSVVDQRNLSVASRLTKLPQNRYLIIEANLQDQS